METVFISDQAIEDIVRVLLFGFLGFAIAMLLTPVYTHFAYKYEWWKKQSTSTLDGQKAKIYAKLHAAKHRTNIPTMAGLIMLIAVVGITLALNFSREQTYLPLAAFVGAGLIGLIDDAFPIIGKGDRGIAGLGARHKMFMILTVGVIGGLYFYSKLGYDSIFIPFINGGTDWHIGALLVPLFALVVAATANSVNITDGLDGLAGGLLLFAYSAFGSIAFLQGNFGIAGFCMTIVGVLLAYIWFNIHPARFFMGDVGSFALGTGLGVVAMLTDTLVLLPIIGAVFVFETATVIIQQLSKKLRGKKIFLSTPIHHHFEAIGWPETKVTMRFWVIGLVTGVLGTVLALLGGHV
jgi:phospho-N-acetylmuramoyl-pentapeptide-transferase